MIPVQDIYQGFYMSVANELPLLIQVITPTANVTSIQEKNIENRLINITCLYLKFILPDDIQHWEYIKKLFIDDISEIDQDGLYYFNNRKLICKVSSLTKNLQQINLLLDLLSHFESAQTTNRLFHRSKLIFISSKKHTDLNNISSLALQSNTFCKLKIKFMPTNQIFIHKFDPLDTKLTQVRQWVETLIHKDLPFNQFKFIQRYPFHTFNEMDELKTLASLNFIPNVALAIIDSPKPKHDTKNLIKLFPTITINKSIPIVNNLLLTLKYVWDYFKFLDREKINYILVDPIDTPSSSHNDDDHSSTNNNIPSHTNTYNMDTPYHSRLNFQSDIHTLNDM